MLTLHVWASCFMLLKLCHYNYTVDPSRTAQSIVCWLTEQKAWSSNSCGELWWSKDKSSCKLATLLEGAGYFFIILNIQMFNLKVHYYFSFRVWLPTSIHKIPVISFEIHFEKLCFDTLRLCFSMFQPSFIPSLFIQVAGSLVYSYFIFAVVTYFNITSTIMKSD